MPGIPAKKPQEPTPRLTLCLAMDLKGSTVSGLRLSTKKLDRFNLALIDQLRPHLSAVQLEHTLVKFTGDGWLVMSDNQEDAAPLCCLAMIMARNFAHEISRESGIGIDNIPAMRLALCWGRDLPVTLVGGQRDFVGSSGRRAVRACQFCDDNEVLVDETVRTWVNHDFVTFRIDLDARLQQVPEAKFEEELALYTLADLKPESADDEDAPVYFVNTLATIGLYHAAGALAKSFSDHLLGRAATADAAQLLARWNALLASNLDADYAAEVLQDLRRAGLKPDVNTYNALIEKSVNYRDQSRWLQAMVQEGIAPTVVTFNALIRNARDIAQIERRLSRMLMDGVAPDAATLQLLIEKAPDYPRAKEWTERLILAGVAPDAAAYEALITKSPSFDVAREWLERMISEGIEPPETAFLAVFAHDVTHLSGEELLNWYLGLRFHPTHPIKRAIAAYRRKGMVDDALRLALDYPHTDTALKTIRQFPQKALAYFRTVVAFDPKHANGAYALGMALVELGQHAEAEHWLRTAYQLASPGTRKDELARYLTLFESMTTRAGSS